MTHKLVCVASLVLFMLAILPGSFGWKEMQFWHYYGNIKRVEVEGCYIEDLDPDDDQYKYNHYKQICVNKGQNDGKIRYRITFVAEVESKFLTNIEHYRDSNNNWNTMWTHKRGDICQTLSVNVSVKPACPLKDGTTYQITKTLDFNSTAKNKVIELKDDYFYHDDYRREILAFVLIKYEHHSKPKTTTTTTTERPVIWRKIHHFNSPHPIESVEVKGCDVENFDPDDDEHYYNNFKQICINKGQNGGKIFYRATFAANETSDQLQNWEYYKFDKDNNNHWHNFWKHDREDICDSKDVLVEPACPIKAGTKYRITKTLDFNSTVVNKIIKLYDNFAADQQTIGGSILIKYEIHSMPTTTPFLIY